MEYGIYIPYSALEYVNFGKRSEKSISNLENGRKRIYTPWKSGRNGAGRLIRALVSTEKYPGFLDSFCPVLFLPTL
jgi:hypothetical protein